MIIRKINDHMALVSRHRLSVLRDEFIEIRKELSIFNSLVTFMSNSKVSKRIRNVIYFFCTMQTNDKIIFKYTMYIFG